MLRRQGRKSIVEVMKLDLHNPREQAIANTFIKRFDRVRFQQRLMNWIVGRNHFFSIAEENELREIFDYMNPSVSICDANLIHTTIKDKVTSALKRHKQKSRCSARRLASSTSHLIGGGPEIGMLYMTCVVLSGT